MISIIYSYNLDSIAFYITSSSSSSVAEMMMMIVVVVVAVVLKEVHLHIMYPVVSLFFIVSVYSVR